jgi:hypothetical protein
MRIFLLMLFAVATCQPTAPRAPDEPAPEQTAATREGIVLTTDRQTYAPGQTLRLILRNETQHPLGYNLCLSTLERREGEQWVAVPPDPDEICTTHLAVLLPGGETHYDFTLAAALPAGQFRYRTSIENMGTNQTAPHTSPPFQVQR